MTRLYSIALLSILLFTSACGNNDTNSPAIDNSSKPHDFSLQTLGGSKTISLKDFKGKPVIINFWASWCAPCREEMPFLQNIWTENKDKGLIFIGIDVMDDTKAAQDFLKSFNIDYLNLNDSSGKVSNAYKVVALPATFFIDKQGNIIKKNYGPFLGDTGENLFKKYLGEILK